MDIGKNQNEIRKVEAYVKKHEAPRNVRFDASAREIFAIVHELTHIEGVMLAFSYGKAKGYRQAKKELQRKIA